MSRPHGFAIDAEALATSRLVFEVLTTTESRFAICTGYLASLQLPLLPLDYPNYKLTPSPHYPTTARPGYYPTTADGDDSLSCKTC